VGSVRVREARAGDLAALVRLYKQLAEDRTESLPAGPDTAAAALGAIEAQAGRTLLVATVDGAVVGTADVMVMANLTHRGSPWAMIENVVVDEASRRSGIGRALMEEVIRRCDADGCYKIQLLSREHRRGAHVFYERLGFERAAIGLRRYLA
jgi:GNAT superfamily N-acetyltransferase